MDLVHGTYGTSFLLTTPAANKTVRWVQAGSCRFNALSSDATLGHREPYAETNSRVGIKFAAQNVIDVSTVVALSYGG